MRPFWAHPVHSPLQGRIHPVLKGFAGEWLSTLAHLAGYVGALALLVAASFYFWELLPVDEAMDRPTRPEWQVADHSYPAFAARQVGFFR